MKRSIPIVMKAIRQDEANGTLYIAEVPVPQPAKGEVLVKMAASPLNPSDFSFLRGTYVHLPNYPVIPGIEGSGTVVASGGGMLANYRMGKRVTCSASENHGGTWAEYMVTSAMRVIPLKKQLTMEQGSMLIVNPMTALAFINIAQKGHHKAIVNNAAASVLGQMMVKLCQKETLPLINIVRRQEQVDLLTSMGAQYVLNSSDLNFEIQLKSLSEQLKATLFLDAVTGEQTQVLLRAAPFGSKILIYSNMSGDQIQVEPRLLIQGNKSIESFYLGIWASKRSIFQTLKAAGQAQKLVNNELVSGIQKRFALENAQDALEYYSEHMTGGKVLLKME
ncbi:MAG: alcohol dehydrogenase catalytic domain-containing protein [Prolixibacteraceae bacterium]